MLRERDKITFLYGCMIYLLAVSHAFEWTDISEVLIYCIYSQCLFTDNNSFDQ